MKMRRHGRLHTRLAVYHGGGRGVSIAIADIGDTSRRSR